jgi:hypothetical protein
MPLVYLPLALYTWLRIVEMHRLNKMNGYSLFNRSRRNLQEIAAIYFCLLPDFSIHLESSSVSFSCKSHSQFLLPQLFILAVAHSCSFSLSQWAQHPALRFGYAHAIDSFWEVLLFSNWLTKIDFLKHGCYFHGACVFDVPFAAVCSESTQCIKTGQLNSFLLDFGYLEVLYSYLPQFQLQSVVVCWILLWCTAVLRQCSTIFFVELAARFLQIFWLCGSYIGRFQSSTKFVLMNFVRCQWGCSACELRITTYSSSNWGLDLQSRAKGAFSIIQAKAYTYYLVHTLCVRGNWSNNDLTSISWYA